MSVLTVRNLGVEVRDRLKAQAAAHGRSMEAEARAILSAAVAPKGVSETGLGSRIADLFADEPAPHVERSGEPARAAGFEA
ncbi:FitA-like ribbon-helix-helix domain-containing protein [Amnibacterium endophyticum]|uniref:Arc family DNA-binding protein n=1 Tax=Amnibacterium endophyticum TaxID=2109337 RepID=A0ABW4LJX7_9MICO